MRMVTRLRLRVSFLPAAWLVFVGASIAWSLNAAETKAPSVPAGATYATIDEAIARGDVADVKRHLDRDPRLVEGVADSKMTPLQQAILRRRSAIAILLLERGANVEVADPAGRTPVHLAVERNDAEVVKAILKRKPDLGKRDRMGWTPLHHAAAKNLTPVAVLMLDQGADPNRLSELGGTALHEAAAAGSVEMVNLLLARGTDPSVRSKTGVNALDLGREYKHPEVVAILEKVKR